LYSSIVLLIVDVGSRKNNVTGAVKKILFKLVQVSINDRLLISKATETTRCNIIYLQCEISVQNKLEMPVSSFDIFSLPSMRENDGLNA
jgi:hypothetical protein